MTVSDSAILPPSPIKAFFQKYFIDAFTGMALGLFVTLIAGLIISQIGGWLICQHWSLSVSWPQY